MTQASSSSQLHVTGTKARHSGGVAQLVAVGLFFVVAVILGGLWWWRNGLPGGPDVAYTQFGPIRITSNGYAMLTTLSVQSSTSDARWVKENTAPLLQALQEALAETEVPALRNPDGLQRLQDRLRQAANAALPGSHVQHVFITDMVYQSEDE